MKAEHCGPTTSSFGPNKKDERHIDKAIERLETMENLLITVDYFIADFRQNMELLAATKMELNNAEKEVAEFEQAVKKPKVKSVGGFKLKVQPTSVEDNKSDKELLAANYYSKYALTADQ